MGGRGLGGAVATSKLLYTPRLVPHNTVGKDRHCTKFLGKGSTDLKACYCDGIRLLYSGHVHVHVHVHGECAHVYNECVFASYPAGA